MSSKRCRPVLLWFVVYSWTLSLKPFCHVDVISRPLLPEVTTVKKLDIDPPANNLSILYCPLRGTQFKKGIVKIVCISTRFINAPLFVVCFLIFWWMAKFSGFRKTVFLSANQPNVLASWSSCEFFQHLQLIVGGYNIAVFMFIG